MTDQEIRAAALAWIRTYLTEQMKRDGYDVSGVDMALSAFTAGAEWQAGR